MRLVVAVGSAVKEVVADADIGVVVAVVDAVEVDVADAAAVANDHSLLLDVVIELGSREDLLGHY